MSKADVTQRTVPAKGQPLPATTAASSVFAAGKAPKARREYTRTTLNPAAVVIRKAVPIPPSNAPSRESAYLALLQRMNKGDSVELTRRQATSLRSEAKKAGITVTVRHFENDVSGVWRT